jgi:sec-independent protein translocase protein TatA
MGMTSIWHWLVVLLIVLVLFGAGKIPRLMGDLAKGVKAFKTGLKDEDEKAADAAAPGTAAGQTPAPAGTVQAQTSQAQTSQAQAAEAMSSSSSAQPAQPAGHTVRN